MTYNSAMRFTPLINLNPQYLYLVKNLRGIVYFSQGLDVNKELDWLKRKFRYRDLGISETLKLEKKWKKLIELPQIVEDPALDSLFQASRFLCGLIVLKEKSLDDFRKGIIVKLKTNEKLSDKDLKFNLRLLDYAITDFYLESIELGKKSNLEGRRKLAEEDLKRYWRIESDESGRTLVAYIDPLLIKPDLKDPLLMSLVPAIVLEF